MKSIAKLLILLLPCFGMAQNSISINSNNGKTKMSISQNGNNFSMEYEGSIVLTEDDSDILSISDDGYVEIKKTAFGSKRRVFIESDNGQLIRKYYVGSKEIDFDPEGRRWLAEILEEVVRSTTLAAEQRVDRIYLKGGAKAVLAEVGEISSDHVKARYLELLTHRKLTEKELILVLDAIGDIDSDHHKVSVLQGNMYQYLGNDEFAKVFIRTTAGIHSDHHKADIIRSAIQSHELKNQEIATMLRIANNINSDHQKANVLLNLAELKDLDKSNLALLIGSTEQLNSDHYKADVLARALSIPDISEVDHNSIVTAIRSMNSDHQKAEILEKMLEGDVSTQSLNNINVIIGRDMNSDHEKGKVLMKLIDENDITSETIDALSRAISSINSDHQKGEIMHRLSFKDLDDNQLIEVAEIIKRINSDHTKEDALISFAPLVRKSATKVKTAFTECVKTLSSDTSQDRIIRLFK
jgi:hypothetical protein